ncbi:hypothetical protein B2G71_22075 [Novosphingobium sp. PC22D]|nr:hypothetical protein B2G71_22075 [Novosphingobium sp. PC22D]
MIDVVAWAEVFELAEQYGRTGGLGAYKVVIVSENGGMVRGWSGVAVEARPWAELEGSSIDTIIVAGGGPPADPPVPSPAVEWLAANAGNARRICGVCTGTFLLAAAGLCERRRITTHWQSRPTILERYDLEVAETDPVYVRDGKLWTTAGFTAGMDMALALIEEDVGHSLSVDLAGMLVMFLKRPGVQPQLSLQLSAQRSEDPDFSRLHAWILEHIEEDLRVERLAEQVGMTPRTFERRYTSSVGRTPARTVAEIRLEKALGLLSRNDRSLKDVARSCGFSSEQQMRRTFVRLRGGNPSDTVWPSGGGTGIGPR